MSYNDKENLKALIREFIINERLSSGGAGKDWTPGEGGAAYTKGSQGAADFGDRWGWGPNTPKAELASGIAGLFGLPQSTVDFWDSLFGSEGFFASIWKLATDTGKFFIDIFTKTTQPSPASPRVESWTRKMFPKTNAFVSNPKKFSWGSSYGKVSVPSLGPKSDIEFDFKAGSRVNESILTEQDFSLEFLASLSSDIENVVQITNQIKNSQGDVVESVRNWQKIIDTESPATVLIPQVQALKEGDLDMTALMDSFVNDVVVPYVKGAFDTLSEGINQADIPEDLKKSADNIIRSGSSSV